MNNIWKAVKGMSGFEIIITIMWVGGMISLWVGPDVLTVMLWSGPAGHAMGTIIGSIHSRLARERMESRLEDLRRELFENIDDIPGVHVRGRQGDRDNNEVEGM